MLRLSEDQEFNAEGPILKQQQVLMNKYSAPFGGLQLYSELLFNESSLSCPRHSALQLDSPKRVSGIPGAIQIELIPPKHIIRAV